MTFFSSEKLLQKIQTNEKYTFQNDILLYLKEETEYMFRKE